MKPGLPPAPPVHARRVVFRNGDTPLIGQIWIPARIAQGRGHPAIVLATPGSSVKEQIGANYASRLAREGFVAITFDPSHQGESGGKPRDLEDPATRIEDIGCAVDFLSTLPFVDEEQIGVLGICAGGGYAVQAAMTDRRIRAAGLVVPVNIGRAFRQMENAADGWAATLDTVAAERNREARGGQERRDPWLPDTLEDAHAAGIDDRDTLEAVRYYRTERGGHARSSNRLLLRSRAALLAFDAFHLVEELLVQPVQIVVAERRGNTGSFEDGEALFRRAANAKDFTVVANAGHYDLYDEPEPVEQAVHCLTRFYRQWLAA